MQILTETQIPRDLTLCHNKNICYVGGLISHILDKRASYMLKSVVGKKLEGVHELTNVVFKPKLALHYGSKQP